MSPTSFNRRISILTERYADRFGSEHFLETRRRGAQRCTCFLFTSIRGMNRLTGIHAHIDNTQPIHQNNILFVNNKNNIYLFGAEVTYNAYVENYELTFKQWWYGGGGHLSFPSLFHSTQFICKDFMMCCKWYWNDIKCIENSVS